MHSYNLVGSEVCFCYSISTRLAKVLLSFLTSSLLLFAGISLASLSFCPRSLINDWRKNTFPWKPRPSGPGCHGNAIIPSNTTLKFPLAFLVFIRHVVGLQQMPPPPAGGILYHTIFLTCHIYLSFADRSGTYTFFPLMFHFQEKPQPTVFFLIHLSIICWQKHFCLYSASTKVNFLLSS